MTAFWDTALIGLGIDRRFRGAYCIHHQGDEPAFIITLTMESVLSLKHLSTTVRLHSALSQKAVISMLSAVRT
jgi:hypothetical protein